MKTLELIFLETDDSCAYCGFKHRENLTKHHIDRNPNNNNYDNLIVLCHNCHHRLTNNKGIAQKDIFKRKKNLISKTLTQYGVNAIKLACRKNIIIPAIPFLVCHLIEMGYMKYIEPIMYDADIDYLAKFELTPKGKILYDKWLK